MQNPTVISGGAQTLVSDAGAQRAAYAVRNDSLKLDLEHFLRRRLGDYELYELIGEGGMGAVYRAHQISLDREVAVKVLSAQWATPDFAERFHREAQNAARLEHPHIVAIHEVGTAETLHFYSMRLVRGETLQGKLERDGRQTPAAAAALLIPIARAIDYANDLGVLHLDLKPANVLLDDDKVPHVADFGLARRLERERALSNEEICGTPSYMAPEQASSGLQKISAATDVWGLGAMLYELVTGEPPFRGSTPQATLDQVRHGTPRSARSLVPTLPRDLDAILNRCLARNPAQRYQTAGALADDLEAFVAGKPVHARPLNPLQRLEHWVQRERKFAIAATLAIIGLAIGIVATTTRQHHEVNEEAAVSIPEHSIAVLPFVNMSDDKSNEYFSDGISEELLNLLAKVPQLQVTARTSSFSFKGKEVAIPEIARVLHVANVLEGSVRKSGNAVRITAQLIRAGTDTHLWSQTYDRKLDDIFAIQDEIAADVVKQLKVTLKLTLLGTAPTARTTDPEAYALYLQAKQLGRQQTAEAFKQSDALYRKVLAIDPRYAPAWDGLATNFLNETGQGLLPNKEGFVQAREATLKALAIDPEYAPAHADLGWIAMYGDNDLAGAAQHFKRALALDPADLDVLRNSATLLQSLGRLDEALALAEAVVRRDPVNVTALYNLGYFQRMAGRFDAAIATLRTALNLAPGRGDAHSELGNALLLKGDAQGALAEIEQETSENWTMIGLPMAYHALGRKADSDAALAVLIAKWEKESPSNIAYVFAYRGDADKAFEWLDKAVEYGDPGISEIVTENLFDKIHTDPRWLQFLRKIGKAPEQLAKIEFKVTLPQADANATSGGSNK